MIYDISQPLIGCQTYPGDLIPEIKKLHSFEKGDLYNLSELRLSVHNGTHVDAPKHFLPEGKDISQISLDKFYGPCFVVEAMGTLTSDNALSILKKTGGYKKILLKGDLTVTEEAAEIFACADLDLIGVESQFFGPVGAPMRVHKILLEKEIVLLEGIRLGKVKEGIYLLSCFPLDLSDADGSPCRAVLWKEKKEI